MLAPSPLAARARQAAPVLGLVLLVAIIYFPCLGGDYIWDDRDGLMLGNPQMEADWGWLENWYAPQTFIYEPLTFDTFWIQCRLFGENRFVFHGTNVLLHALNAWLLVLVLERLSLRGAWLAGLLFAVHPVCVESTAWIYERNNLLSVFFALLSALAFLRSEQAPRWYVAALVLFACSLLSKSLTVMFPLALAGYVVARPAGNLARRWWQIVPFFALSTGLGLLRWQSEQVARGGEGREFAGLTERCLNAGQALSFYLSKACLPWDLWTVYPKWTNDASSWATYVACLPGLLALCLAVALWRTSWRPVSWGIAFFALQLVPLLGFVDNAYFRYTFVADRWQYLAMIGLLAALAFALTRLIESLRSAPRWTPALASCALVVPLAALSWNQAHVYQNMETWCRFTLAKNPEAYFAHVNLANVLLEQGEHQAALKHLRKAFDLRPGDPKIALNLGDALLQGQEMKAAAHVYRRAAAARPDSVRLHYNLGLAEVLCGRRAAAARAFAKTLSLDPDFAPAHDKLGALAVACGKPAEGLPHLQAAVRLQPAEAGYHFNLGTAQAGVADFAGAQQSFARTLELHAQHREARLCLAKVQIHIGQLDEARGSLEALVEHHPGDAEAEALLRQVSHRLSRSSAFPARH